MARKASLAALAANKLSSVTASNTAANAAATTSSASKPQAAAVKQRTSLTNTATTAAAAAVVFHDNTSTDSDSDDESSYNESDPLQSKQQSQQQQQKQQQQQQQAAPIASTPPASPQHSPRRRTENDAWGSPSCTRGANSASGVSITLDCAADAAEEQCLSPRGAEYSMQLRKQVSVANAQAWTMTASMQKPTYCLKYMHTRVADSCADAAQQWVCHA
jgi:hypothetical protein